MNIAKKYTKIVFGFFSLGFASIAFAQTPTLANPLGQSATFETVLANFNIFLLAIAAPICGIMVVWGGFQMITSRGNPEKFSEGKKTLLYAAVGFIVIIFATSVVPLIKSIFGGS